MKRMFARLAQDERGATAVEYGMICALIFLAAISAIVTVGSETIEMWDYVSNEVQAVD